MNPYAQAPNSKKMLTLIGVFVAVLVTVSMSSGQNVVLPIAAEDIGGADIYPLANSFAGWLGIALMPLYGFLSARNPAIKRNLTIVSFIISGLVILSRGFATDMWFIVIPSIALSVYSPAIFVLGYATIRDMYDAKKAGMFLGFVGTIMSIGMIVGPSVFGFLTDVAGWRLTFYILGPMLMLAALFTFLGVRITREQAKDVAMPNLAFDFIGAIAVVFFLSCTTLALALTSFLPFGSVGNTILWIVAAAAIAILIWDISKKKGKAFIPSTVLSNKNVLGLFSYNFCINFGVMSCFIFIPMFAIYILGQSSFWASLTISAMAVPGLFLGPIYGRIMGKAGNARGVAVLTSAVRIAVLVAFIVILTPTSSIYLVYALMFVLGVSSAGGAVVPAVGPQVQLAPEIRQLGNSVVQLGAGFGSSISIAVYTMLIGMHGVADGIRYVFIVAAAVSVVMLFTSLMLKKLPKAEAPTESPAPKEA